MPTAGVDGRIQLKYFDVWFAALYIMPTACVDG